MKQELPENAGKLSHVGSHCDVRKACEYKSIYKSERKRSFFSKQFSKFRATNDSNVQIKRLLQNETTDYNNCTYIETTLLIANLLFRDIFF